MTSFLSDLRYAARQLRKTWGSTAIALLTLALGIGATITIFTMVDALVLRPMPFGTLDRLVAVRQWSPQHCSRCTLLATGNFVSVSRTSKTLDVAAAEQVSPTLREGDRSDIVRGHRVTGNFFRVLGLDAARGRVFVPGDDTPGASPVVLLGYAFWMSRFGGDTAIIGRTVHLDGEQYTVVGVMPPGREFPPGGQLWMPLVLTPEAASDRGSTDLDVFGRLTPGATLASARHELSAIGARLAEAYPDRLEGWTFDAYPIRDWRSMTRLPLLVLLGAVGFVLLIACANLAGLLLARAAGRRVEVAVRLALGAPRRRIVRQLLTESIMLAGAGGTLGFAFTLWAIPAFRAAIPVSMTRELLGWNNIAIDGRIVVFALGMVLATGLLFGIGPALHLSSTALNGGGTLNAGGGGARAGTDARSSRARAVLVAAEVGVTTLLLVVTTLVTRSVVNMYSQNPGLSTDHVATMTVRLPASGTTPSGGPAGEVFERLVGQLEASPIVQSAAVINTLPLSTAFASSGFEVDGAPTVAADRPSAGLRVVSGHYFDVLRVPRLRGRTFTAKDDAGAPHVAIINQTLANRYFAGINPIGRGLIVNDERCEIVGVVGDVLHRGALRGVDPEIYRPESQVAWRSVSLVVRTRTEPGSAANEIRREVMQFDREIGIANVLTMDEVAAQALAPFRAVAVIYGSLALTGVLISIIGLYGIVSYLVGQRAREFAVRLALGAEPSQLLWRVLGAGMRLAALGVVIGLAGAAAVARLLDVFLHDVAPHDPLTFVVSAVLLLGAAFLATLMPARRALKADPATSLRTE